MITIVRTDLCAAPFRRDLAIIDTLFVACFISEPLFQCLLLVADSYRRCRRNLRSYSRVCSKCRRGQKRKDAP